MTTGIAAQAASNGVIQPPELAPRSLSLYEKLIEIRKSVPYLKKGNQGYQYSYVSSSQTLGSLRAKMDELGVLLIPRVSSHKMERSESENDKGKMSVQFFTEVDMVFDWVNAENPADTISCPWYSQGKDTGEKGIGKAYTYGEKYFMLKFFNIATDKDDPDAFQQRREEAGKVRKVRTTQPPDTGAPPPTEAPAPANGQAKYPDDKRNPYMGMIHNISAPIEGNTDGKPWKYWELETNELNLICFDKGVYEVACNAVSDNLPVEIIWKLKRRAKSGQESCLAESIRILDPDERAIQAKK